MEGERPSLRDETRQDAPNPSEQGSSRHVQGGRRRSTRKRTHTLLDSVLLERYPFQTQVRALVQNPAYENFILVLVFINCILLAVFNPSKITVETKAKLDIVETAFLLTFTLEALLYINAFGVVRFNNSYLRNGWTILDGIVVVIGGDGGPGDRGTRNLHSHSLDYLVHWSIHRSIHWSNGPFIHTTTPRLKRSHWSVFHLSTRRVKSTTTTSSTAAAAAAAAAAAFNHLGCALFACAPYNLILCGVRGRATRDGGPYLWVTCRGSDRVSREWLAYARCELCVPSRGSRYSRARAVW